MFRITAEDQFCLFYQTAALAKNAKHNFLTSFHNLFEKIIFLVLFVSAL
jgi:hypothetical protein